MIDTSDDVRVRSFAWNVSLVKNRGSFLALRPVYSIISCIGKEVKFTLVFTVLVLDLLHN